VREVKFLRIDCDAEERITKDLAPFYKEGWRVISHTESSDEYTFVLERITCSECGWDFMEGHASQCSRY
jgi:predicted Zn-ribbon and HTH transcriptional regulator